jgi:uncharacterized membrane protein
VGITTKHKINSHGTVLGAEAQVEVQSRQALFSFGFWVSLWPSLVASLNTGSLVVLVLVPSEIAFKPVALLP